MKFLKWACQWLQQQASCPLNMLTSGLSSAADSSVVLASHLPWLLHLLLLTHVGCANAEESSARTTGARHEASENLSATTVQYFASPGSRWAGTAGQAQRSSPQAAESHSERHESHSISMASNHVSSAEKVRQFSGMPRQCNEMHGAYKRLLPLWLSRFGCELTHFLLTWLSSMLWVACVPRLMDMTSQRCLRQPSARCFSSSHTVQESPGRIDDGGARQQSPHDRPLISAAAAAIQHVLSGPKLCIWLGLTADKLDVQQEAEPCLQQSVNVAENARLAAEVVEVCMEALLQADQVSMIPL